MRHHPGLAAFGGLICLLLACIVTTACGKTSASGTGRTTSLDAVQPIAAGKTLTAAATTTQIADYLRNVGGNRITVVELIAAGQDPHEFEPKPEDIQKLNAADIVFKNG